MAPGSPNSLRHLVVPDSSDEEKKTSKQPSKETAGDQMNSTPKQSNGSESDKSKPAKWKMVKRSREDNQVIVSDDSKSKKKKMKTCDDGGSSTEEEEPKKLLHRLWSEDDEVIILNGLIEHFADRGAGEKNVMIDLDAYNFIKKSLKVEVSKLQLSEKVRRLKKKFKNNAKSKDYNPTKRHDQKVFDLSKKIWGSREDQKDKASAVEGVVFSMREELTSVGIDHGLVRLIPESEKADAALQWTEMFITEQELFVKKTLLINKIVKLFLDMQKPSGH